MKHPVLTALGAAAAVAYLNARRDRRLTERLAAAAFEALLNAIDANDPETGAHVRRVAVYSEIIGRAAGLRERDLHDVERVALFHDIGKIHEALADVVRETDSLSPEERERITTHPRRGAEVLRPLCEFYPELSEGVLSHHECWDGSGYPRALRGERIPLTARIVAIADAFDAITERRRYHAPRSPREALDVIAAGRGTQFDPDLVGLFLSPGVQRQVDRARRTAHTPQGAGPERRRRGTEGTAPDVIFRWRPESAAPRSRDPERQAERESAPPRSPPR
ncbi:MAG: HD-GYP domain-containing protein [Gemmatimonadaceae bacterium]